MSLRRNTVTLFVVRHERSRALGAEPVRVGVLVVADSADAGDELGAVVGRLDFDSAGLVPSRRRRSSSTTAPTSPLGRRVTDEEAESLSRLLQGDDGLEIVILPIEDGVRIFYAPVDVLTTAKESASPEVRATLQARRKDLLQRVSTAVDEVYPELREAPVEFRTFTTDGGYLENDWRVSPNAEAYRRLYSAFDGPDLRAGMDKLRGRIGSINDEFADRYG